MAMGGTGLCFRDVHAALTNPAGLAGAPSASALATAEQRFLISDIRSVAAVGALPAGDGAFGLTLHYYGFEDYNEQRAGLAYARKLFDQLSLGAQFLVLNTRIPEYGNKALFTFEMGFVSRITPELNLGAKIHNPVHLEIAEGDRLPTVLSVGLSYQPSSGIAVNAEVEKDIEFPLRARFGLEYRVAEPLFLRVGCGTNPTLASFGAGFALENGLAIDVASSYHQVLGFTPGVNIVFQKK